MTGRRILDQVFMVTCCDRKIGARQSGVPLLRFADLERDVALIEQARDGAEELLAREPAAAAAHLERWLGGRAEFIRA